MGGEVFCYLDLAHYLGSDQTIFGLQARGWGGEGEQEATVEEMAAAYLHAVRERQPNGPYFLAGWSFGGLVALEMAQQLLAAGELIQLLAVMDTNMVSHLNAQSLPNLPNRSYMDWPKIILKFARPGAEIPEEDLRRFNRVEDQVAHAIDRGVLPPGLTVEDAMCYVRSSSSNTRAKNSYFARPYKGKVTLFRARQGHILRCPDPSLGWQKIAQGGLEIIDVSGEHDVMVEMPHVGELARKLRESFDRACESGASAMP
jgi:thioesterase domain-containing protein